VKWDPTPTTVAATLAPKVINWVDRMDDLSWLPVSSDQGWVASDNLPEATHRLLHEIGQTYAPFMLANLDALNSGADEVECTIADYQYRQSPFRYQGKCLQWLREAHQNLDSEARHRVDNILDGTGCETLFYSV